MDLMKVEILGLDKSVEIDCDAIKPYTIDGETYEQTAIADDGTFVAFCPASVSWVQLWGSKPEDY